MYSMYQMNSMYSMLCLAFHMRAETVLGEVGALCPHFCEASVRLVGSRGATWVTWQTMGTCCALVSTSFCSMYSIEIPRYSMIVSPFIVKHNMKSMYSMLFHAIPSEG